jgi:hypothetical protein
MLEHRLLYSAFALAAALSGCAAPGTLEADLPPKMTECPNPRPEMCTREYAPVCGAVLTGVQCVTSPCSSTVHQTFGNKCDACANPQTVGYMDGACGENNMGAKQRKR